MSGKSNPVNRWMEHISALAADIGPRGSTTGAERRAAEYCARVYSGLGLTPHLEAFTSATSGYQPHLFVALTMLISFAVYPWQGRATAFIALLLAALGIFSEIREMLFKDHPLRWLITRGESQNVYTQIQPAGDHCRDLILIGHLDTNRTPLIFATHGWTDFWRIVTPVIFVSFWVQAALYLIGSITQWAWVWPVSGICAAFAALLLAITAQADMTPYGPGANDNATGAGLVLTLAEHLIRDPLQHTRVWFLNTGCEEVKHYGAIDFFDRHRAEFHNPRTLVFEMLGIDGPAWLEREVILPPFAYRASPELIATATDIAETYPAHPVNITGGHTEMADALRVGIPAMTFIGVRKEGVKIGYDGPFLFWHHPEDTPDKIQPQVLGQAYDYIWEFIQRLDNEPV